MTPARLWLAIFGIWAIFLSGALTPWVGSPGVAQALNLKSLLNSKLALESGLQDGILKLQTEAVALEKDRVVQLREVRRVLGYAATDELVFDFSGEYSAGQAH